MMGTCVFQVPGSVRSIGGFDLANGRWWVCLLWLIWCTEYGVCICGRVALVFDGYVRVCVSMGLIGLGYSYVIMVLWGFMGVTMIVGG